MRPRSILIAIGCVLVAAIWFAVKSAREEARKWQPIKGGGRIRIFAASGGSQQIHIPGPPFSERVRSAWQQRSLQPLNAGGRTITASSGGTTKLAIWAEIQGVPGNGFQGLYNRIGRIRDYEIPLSDGQILLGMQGGSSSYSMSQMVCYLARFDFAPRRERELTLTFTFEDEKYALKFANPTYQPNLPAWSGDPLPSTFQQEDLTVTLEDLKLQWNRDRYYYGTRWALRPQWTITQSGRRVDSWFQVGSVFSDAAGNTSSYTGLLGEPALKLNGQVSRTISYPFAPSEVRWLARFDPDELRKMPNGKHQVHKMSGDVLARGIFFVGALTPGLYELDDGKVISAAPPLPDKPIKRFNAVLDLSTRRLRLEVPEVAFVQHLQRHISDDEDEFRIGQYDDGKGLILDVNRSGQTGNEIVTWASLPKRPFRYGLAKQRKFQFEMLVKPPKAPQPPKANGDN